MIGYLLVRGVRQTASTTLLTDAAALTVASETTSGQRQPSSGATYRTTLSRTWAL